MSDGAFYPAEASDIVGDVFSSAGNEALGLHTLGQTVVKYRRADEPPPHPDEKSALPIKVRKNEQGEMEFFVVKTDGSLEQIDYEVIADEQDQAP